MSNESQRISELPQLSELNDNDYLVLQRGKQSYKVKFDKFKEEFLKYFNENSGVKSAISCDESMFARFDHGHDYSDIFFYPTYGPQSQNVNPELRISNLSCKYCGKFNITKYDPGIDQSTYHEISVFSPPAIREIHNEVAIYDKYKVGDLQYLAVKNFESYLTVYRNYSIINIGEMQNIDINSPSFDGFVIPNGTTFTCSPNDFQEACQLYADDPNATSFTVPDIANTFFKCDPGLSDMTAMDTIPYHNALPLHNHGGSTLQSSSSSQVNEIAVNLGPSQIRVSRTPNTYKGYKNPYVHWAYGSKYSKKCPIKIVSVSIKGAVTGMNIHKSGDDSESYPSHQYMQMLLYIGRK